MSKFKLFLLAWFVSLIGIGSFTNAQFFSEENINITWNDKVFSPSVIHLSVPINQVNFTANSWWDECSVLFENSAGTYRCRVYFNVYSNPAYSQCSDAVFYWDVNVRYDARDCLNWGFSVNYTVAHDSMPVSSLSPVINWLSESINEFIPYVVYVWLWVLGVLIWFFAIKRLMNRVKRQSFWVFKSRKRK